MNLQRWAFAALCMPVAALAGDLGPDSALSAWHAASPADKFELVERMADQLRTSAGCATAPGIPRDDIVHCVDRNHAPDHLTVADQVVDVTSGMATVLCLKMHVPELRAAKYRMESAAASGR